MTKEEFKERWDSALDGGGITLGDIAECYISWGLGDKPYTKKISYVIYKVCEAANTNDKDGWRKAYEEEEDE